MSDNESQHDKSDLEDPRVKDIQAVAKEIAGLVNEAKTGAQTIEDIQRQLASLFTKAHTKLDEINAVATQATAAKTQIADSQAVIATKSSHIQDAQAHADTVRAELDKTLTAAKQQATEAEGEKNRATSVAEETGKLLDSIRTTKGSAETDAAAVNAAKETAAQSAEKTKNLAEKAEMIEERITGYETRLADLEVQCNTQLKKIEGLLPGATSAHLAHAFDDRRKGFLSPTKRWQMLFVGSLIVLIALASQGIWHDLFSDTPLTYDEVLRLWLSRLPVAGAMVWLAIHASREAALAKRLEEDYGYKSSIASTFLGFYKQMSEVGTEADKNKPLAKLCEDTLATIAAPPGRIYEKHKLVVSPASELAAAGKAAAETLNNLKK